MAPVKAVLGVPGDMAEDKADGVLKGEADALGDGFDGDGLAEEEAAASSSVGLLLRLLLLLLLLPVVGVAVDKAEGLLEGGEEELLEGLDDDGLAEEEAEGNTSVRLLLLLGEVEGLPEGGATTVPATAVKVVAAGVGVVGVARVVMGRLVEGEASLQTRAATMRRTVAKSVPADHACTRRVFWLSGEVGPSSSLWTGLAPAPVAVGP